jgi:hypothetical protein
MMLANCCSIITRLLEDNVNEAQCTIGRSTPQTFKSKVATLAANLRQVAKQRRYNWQELQEGPYTVARMQEAMQTLPHEAAAYSHTTGILGACNGIMPSS